MMVALSAEEQALLNELNKSAAAAPDPTEEEWERLGGAIGIDDERDTGEGEEVAPGESHVKRTFRIRGKTIYINEDDTVDMENWRGGKLVGLRRLTHGDEVYVDPRGKYGNRNPQDTGKWYWDGNKQILVRTAPTSAAPARAAITLNERAETSLAAGDIDLDEELKKAEAELAAMRARSTSTRVNDTGAIRERLEDLENEVAASRTNNRKTRTARIARPEVPEDSESADHRAEVKRLKRRKEVADAEKQALVAENARDAQKPKIEPPAPAKEAVEHGWMVKGPAMDQVERERTVDKALQMRNFAVMGDARKEHHLNRLHEISRKWREYPLWKKIGISAGFLGASVLGSAFLPTSAAFAIGALSVSWRALGSGMAGLAAGLGVKTFAEKRNFSSKTANRAAFGAGIGTSVLSFFGGKWLADYMGWLPADGSGAGGPRVAPAHHDSLSVPPEKSVDASVPLESIPKSVAVDESGFWKKGLTGLFDRFHVFDSLKLSSAAHDQLILAINNTLARDGDMLAALYGQQNINADRATAFLENYVRDGSVVLEKGNTLDLKVLGSKAFLTSLDNEIFNGSKYITLRNDLIRNRFNADDVYNVLRNAYAR